MNAKAHKIKVFTSSTLPWAHDVAVSALADAQTTPETAPSEASWRLSHPRSSESFLVPCTMHHGPFLSSRLPRNPPP